MTSAPPERAKRRRRARPKRLLKRLGSRRMRQQVYDLLDQGSDHPVGMVLQRVIIALIVVSVAGSVLVTVPALDARFYGLFATI